MQGEFGIQCKGKEEVDTWVGGNGGFGKVKSGGKGEKRGKVG